VKRIWLNYDPLVSPPKRVREKRKFSFKNGTIGHNLDIKVKKTTNLNREKESDAQAGGSYLTHLWELKAPPPLAGNSPGARGEVQGGRSCTLLSPGEILERKTGKAATSGGGQGRGTQLSGITKKPEYVLDQEEKGNWGCINTLKKRGKVGGKSAAGK